MTIGAYQWVRNWTRFLRYTMLFNFVEQMR